MRGYCGLKGSPFELGPLLPPYLHLPGPFWPRPVDSLPCLVLPELASLEEQGWGPHLSIWYCFLKTSFCLIPCLLTGQRRRRSTLGTPELWGPGRRNATIPPTTTMAEPCPCCRERPWQAPSSRSLELCDPRSCALTVQWGPFGSLVPLNVLHRREQNTWPCTGTTFC